MLCPSPWSYKPGKRFLSIFPRPGIEKPTHQVQKTGPRVNSGHKKKKKRGPTSKRVEQIFRTKGLTSADRSDKATLPLTVPRSHSSRLQRIHPRAYDKLRLTSKPPRHFHHSGPACLIWYTSKRALFLHKCDVRDIKSSSSLARILT